MISGLTAVPTSNEPSLPSGVDKSLGKDEFLKLMIAQLQAQDPTNPMDAQDFSAQLAQFSSLEQQLAMNNNLEEIASNQAALNNSSMVSLIGKSVNSPGDGIQFTPGEVETLSYELLEDANSVTIDIIDSEGKIVTSLTPGVQSAGIQSAQWSGLDSQGKVVPAGTYAFRVKGTNAAGEQIDAETLSSGTVTEIVFEEGVSYAVVNGSKIPANEISRVGLN